MDEIKIEQIAVDKITPYERNARKHEETDVQIIVNSIKEFGFNDPIGVWGEKNIIVEGHGRLLAAKQLGMESVPCIRLDHLTDEQRRAYAIAHNKTAEMSVWDWGLLDAELNDIFDIDMEQFGLVLDLDIDKTGKKLNDCEEIDIEDYNDEQFECECPRCGFRFNKG